MLYQNSGQMAYIRYILYSTLVFQFLVYIYYIIRYKVTGSTCRLK